MDEGKGVIDRLRQVQDQCLNMLIKPNKVEYHIEDLGPVSQEIRRQVYSRKDFVVPNRQDNLLRCSFFEGRDVLQNLDQSRTDNHTLHQQRSRDMLVYCHSQSGNRMEGIEMLDFCAKYKLNMLVFDFAGCGLSGGHYVSLGWYEHEDIKIVIDQAKHLFQPSDIFLWGRSMGAVASCRYAKIHKNSIKALVLDSPFDDLMKLVKNIAVKRLNIPSMLLSLPLHFITRKVKEIIGVNILELKPSEDIEALDIPVFFITCKEEEVLPPGCVQGLYNSCSSRQKVISCSEGSHSTNREQRVLNEAFSFLFKYSMARQSSTRVSDLQRSINLDRSVTRLNLNHNSYSILSEYLPPSERLYDPFLARGSSQRTSQNHGSIGRPNDKISEYSRPHDGSTEVKKIIISPSRIDNGSSVSRLEPLVSDFSFSNVQISETEDTRGIKRPPTSYARSKLCSGDVSAGQLNLLASKKCNFARSINPLKRSLTDVAVTTPVIKPQEHNGSGETDNEPTNYNTTMTQLSTRSNNIKENTVRDFNTFISSIVSSLPTDPYLKSDQGKSKKLSLNKRKDEYRPERQKLYIPEQLRKKEIIDGNLRVLPIPSFLKYSKDIETHTSEVELLTTPILKKTYKLRHEYGSASITRRPGDNPLKHSFRASTDFDGVLRLQSSSKKQSILMTSLSRSNIPMDSFRDIEISSLKINEKIESQETRQKMTNAVYRPFLEMSYDKENYQPNTRDARLQRTGSCSVMNY